VSLFWRIRLVRESDANQNLEGVGSLYENRISDSN